MRLQKYMAECGVASRRKAEQMIIDGRVKVNGELITELGFKVDENDVVLVDDKKISPESEFVYIMLHKPTGCVTTASDQFDRKTVMDYLSGVKQRVYPVGRLDYDTSGLLLLTNDGELTYRLTHPKHNVDKTYIASLDRTPDEDELERLRKGIMLDERRTAPAEVELLGIQQGHQQVKITIHEGRNRQVRRMCEAIGCKVLRLDRIGVGKLRLGELKKGHYRELTKDEVNYIKSL